MVDTYITAPHCIVSHSQEQTGSSKYNLKLFTTKQKKKNVYIQFALLQMLIKQLKYYWLHTIWFYNFCSFGFLCDHKAQAEHLNVTPLPWVLCSWNMWISLGCYWKLRMTKMQKSSRTSELTSVPWWPILSNVFQVLRKDSERKIFCGFIWLG